MIATAEDHAMLSPGFSGLPWHYLALSLVLCLVVSTPGFKRVTYFVSLGYAASIAAQAIVMPLLYWNTLRDWALVQSVLLLAYGLRLGTFLALRQRTTSYQKDQTENAARLAKLRGPIKAAIWVCVSLLFTLMFLPALLTMSAQAEGQALPSTPLGVLLMVAGLSVEACADWQKSRFKKQNPSHFCDVGLYRVVRFPNYFGEMVFWFGVFISAMSAYQSLAAWGLCSLGFVYLELLMLAASRSLELKQTGRYGADAGYKAYTRRTPILFPGLPLYSLQHLKLLIR
jgi:steroid 5-alpha reductase family enzyme